MRTARLAVLAILLYSFLPAPPAAAQIVSEARELAVGQAVARSFEKRPGFAEHKACAGQVLPIRDALVPHSGRSHLPYAIHILKIREPNAAAVPGFVFLTSGMCDFGLSNDEWAFLLAHEMGHIAGKHTAKMIEQSYALTVMEIAVLIITGSPEIVRLLDTMASISWFGYNRSLETEADLRALRMVIAAGYDPSGGASLFDRLDEYSRRRRGRTHWLDTHPGFQDRITRVRQEIAQMAARGEPLRVVRQHFRDQTDGVAVTVRRAVHLADTVLVDIEVENTRAHAVRVLTVNAAIEAGGAEYGLRLRQTTFDGNVLAGSTVRSTLAFHRPPETVRKATLSLTVLLPDDEARPLLLDLRL